MENLYMVLITTKNSNILEDLETLRLFARVVPDCCPEMTAEQVTESAFELIFAFDEIVALGYREDVNIQQVRMSYVSIHSVGSENKCGQEIVSNMVWGGETGQSALSASSVAK